MEIIRKIGYNVTTFILPRCNLMPQRFTAFPLEARVCTCDDEMNALRVYFDKKEKKIK